MCGLLFVNNVMAKVSVTKLYAIFFIHWQSVIDNFTKHIPKGLTS